MNRKEILTEGLDLQSMTGIEIGALANPIVAKSAGNIIYIDHADTAAIIAKYKGDPNVDISKIVNVDGVWGSNSLLQAAGRKVDYVVSSHVIEHVPNLIAWFEEIDEALNETGEVRLAIPDRRYTFDYYRQATKVSEVVSAYFLGARVPQVQQIVDHSLHFTNGIEAINAWNGELSPERQLTAEDLARASKAARLAIETGDYHDVHCWVFTPESFTHLMLQLAMLGLIKFTCERLRPTQENDLEFFVTMKKCSDSRAILESWKAAPEQDPPQPQPQRRTFGQWLERLQLRVR